MLPQLSNLQWALLAFCGVNTLIAYGSFAEAMAHIEASKVSAILALTPLITVTTVHLIPHTRTCPRTHNSLNPLRRRLGGQWIYADLPEQAQSKLASSAPTS